MLQNEQFSGPHMLFSCEFVLWTLTGRQNAFYKLLSGHFAILIFVNAAEEVHDTRLFMVHPAHVALPPHIKVKVGKFLQLSRKYNQKSDMNNQRSTTLQKNSPSNDSECRFVLDYLLQSVHGIIEFPPSVQSKQPHVLPLGDQQVNPGVLGFNGSLSC